MESQEEHVSGTKQTQAGGFISIADSSELIARLTVTLLQLLQKNIFRPQ